MVMPELVAFMNVYRGLLVDGWRSFNELVGLSLTNFDHHVMVCLDDTLRIIGVCLDDTLR